MTPYSERPKYGMCPKCEAFFDDWDVRFHETAHTGPYGFQSWPESVLPHLDWSCPNCGYSLMTETADAKPAVVA